VPFDPYAQKLPPEYETGPITSPVPTQITPGKALLGGMAALAAPAILPFAAAGLSSPDAGPFTHSPVPAAPPPGPMPASPPPMPMPGPPVAAPAPVPVPARRSGGGAAPATPKVDEFGRQIEAGAQRAQQGVDELQTAKAEGAEAKANLQGGLADLQEAQADERKAAAERNSKLSAHLEEQDAANLKKARDYTIPAFWEGHKGAEIGSIISMAAGGIASGILGGPNGAAQIVQKKVDDYFYREKEKVDNLYKYAEQTGRLNDKTRLRYAQELSDLGAQHLAVTQSVLTRINEVETRNQGAVDRAMVTGLKANLEQAYQKQLQDYRTTQAELANHTLTAKAGAAAAYANAAESRAGVKLKLAQAEAAKAGGGKADDSLIYDASGKPFANAQTPQAATKFREQQRALADLGSAISELEQNYKQGIVAPAGLSAAGRQRDATMSRIVLAAKTVGELGALSGPDMGLVRDLAGGRVGHFLGSPEGIQNLKRLQQNGMNTALSQIGVQPSPEHLQRFALSGSAAPATPGQYPPGARSTKNGRPIVMTANGWQYAQ